MESNLLNKKANFNAVDVAKFILAFCVISIHTCYNLFDNAIINAIYDSVIIRIAVPFFFVASGFFFFRDIVFENGKIKKCFQNRAKFFNFLKRIFFLYLIWAVIYFIWESFTYIEAGISLVALCKNYIFSFFLEGFAGQFWYLLFMMYAIIVLYVLLRFLRIELVGTIVGAVFLFFLYCYTYRVVFNIGSLYDTIMSFMLYKSAVLGTNLNFYLIYAALGFLFAGLLCVYLRDRISVRASGVLALVSLCLSLVENVLIKIFQTESSFRTSNSYTLFLLPIALFGFIFLSKLNLNGNGKIFAFLRNGSSFIYCSHMLIMMIFHHFTDRKFVETPLLFAVISALSLAVTLVFVPLSRKLKFLKKLY